MSKKKYFRADPVLVNEPNVAANKARMIKTARLARRVLQVLAASLALSFTWLKFHGLNFAPLLGDLSASFLLRVTLALYYFSWVSGMASDADAQEVIYVEPPDRNRVITMLALVTVGVAIPFGLLCYVQSYKAFALVLSAFLIFNFFIWRLWAYWLIPKAAEGTADYYKSRSAYGELMELRVYIDDYARGKWQLWRFLVGLLIVVLIDLLSFTRFYRPGTIAGLNAASDFVLATLMFLFVVVMEGWVWMNRIYCRFARQLLDRVDAEYELRPKIR
jgi:hypothetical protein